MYLSEISNGKMVKIVDIDDRCSIKRRLLDMGFVKNTRITVLHSAPFGGPIEVFLRGYKIVLRKKDAALINTESVDINK